jgi:hypothetical protein
MTKVQHDYEVYVGAEQYQGDVQAYNSSERFCVAFVAAGNYNQRYEWRKRRHERQAGDNHSHNPAPAERSD